MVIRVGEVFAGRYELLDPVAEGGMGSVWRIHDRKDDTVKAAKILRQSDASSLLRFMREQSFRIDHEHVVTPLSWAGEDDRVLFTMPLVRGGSVGSLIGDYGPLPLHWVVTLLDQVLHALEAVHAVGIVHRDVKPGNLLLEPTGRGRPHLRLTDFGIAAHIDDPRLTRSSVVMGSLGYIAPELLRGADPDPRQDVYAAGIVGLEMLTGQRPPYDDAQLESLPLPRPPDHAHRLLDILRRCCEGEPADRYAAAADVRAGLREQGLLSFTPEPDDIQVFDVIAALDGSADPAGWADATPTSLKPSRHKASPSAAEGAGTTPPEESPSPAKPRRRAPALALGLVGIACLVAALWIVLAW